MAQPNLTTPGADPKPDVAPKPNPFKARSPSYPSISATKALDIAKAIYATEKRFSVPPITVAKHAGYEGIKSGPSARMLAALRKYRVFEEKEGDALLLHMSEAVRRYVMAPNDADLRTALLADMAARYEEITQAVEKFPHGLPEDEALKFYLVLERKFTDTGADEFIEILRENAALAKPGDVSQGEEVIEPQKTANHLATALKAATPPPKASESFVLRWNVSSDLVVELRASGDLSPEDWELVSDYVAIAKKAASRRAKSDEPKD